MSRRADQRHTLLERLEAADLESARFFLHRVAKTPIGRRKVCRAARARWPEGGRTSANFAMAILTGRDAAQDQRDLGLLLWGLARYEAAVIAFRAAAELGDDEARFDLGTALLWLGDLEQGIAQLTHLTARPDAIGDRAVGAIGRAMATRGESGDGVVAMLEMGMAEQPELVTELTEVLVQRDEIETAVGVLELEVELHNAAAPTLLGGLYDEHLHDEGRAEHSYRAGIRLGDPEAADRLADLLARQGRVREAKRMRRLAARTRR